MIILSVIWDIDIDWILMIQRKTICINHMQRYNRTNLESMYFCNSMKTYEMKLRSEELYTGFQ